jgi:hypothetical protein
MVEEHWLLEDTCVLVSGFQFKQWGTACGLTWEQWRGIQQKSFFAFVNIIGSTRLLTLSSASGACVLFVYSTVRGLHKKVILVSSLIISVTTMITLSRYINDMEAIMSIPTHKVFIQGPGYMVALLSVSVGGIIFFTLVVTSYHHVVVNTGENKMSTFIWVPIYVIALLSIIVAVGEVMTVSSCEDAVSSIDTRACNGGAGAPIMLTNISCGVAGISLYLGVKFWPERMLVNNFLGGVTLLLFALSCMVVNLADRFESPAIGLYSAYVGIIFIFLFLGVYNDVGTSCYK